MNQKRSVQQVIEAHKNSGRFFTVDGLQSFTLDQGEGEVVFCIHGVPTSSFLYRKLLGALARKGYRGIAIDLPGLGFADRPEDFQYNFQHLARFCGKAAEVLGLERFHLVVHDIGGPIGFALAAEHPEKILSLTILNTWIDVVNFKKPLPMRPFEKPVLGEAELALFTPTTWKIIFKTMGVKDKSKTPDEEIYAYIDLLKRDDDGKAYLKLMRNFEHDQEFRTLCYQAVQNVPYPIQAIWGADDPLLTLKRYGQEIKEIAGLTGIHELPAKHFLQEEQWETIAEKIDQLVRKP